MSTLNLFVDPLLRDVESLQSSCTVNVDSIQSRFRIMLSFLYAAGGSLVAADPNGAPCSGSAKIREREAGAVFFDMDIDLQADGEADPPGRRPELIESAGGHAVRCCQPVLRVLAGLHHTGARLPYLCAFLAAF